MCSVIRRRVLRGFHRRHHFDILGTFQTNMKQMIRTANPDFSKSIYSCVRAFRMITTPKYLISFREGGVENFNEKRSMCYDCYFYSDDDCFLLHSSIEVISSRPERPDDNFINLKCLF